MTLEYLLILTWLYLFYARAQNICVRDGFTFDSGDSIKENCNECTCVRLSKFSTKHGFRCTTKKCLIQPRIISDINSGINSWRAANYSNFWGLTLEDGARYKLGTFPPEANVAMMTPVFIQRHKTMPSAFDTRDKWPNFIHPPQDQGNCGASWAFSTTGVASDRVAIQSHGTFTGNLSPQQLLSCGQNGSRNSCDGGYVDRAWYYIRHNGIVADDCYQYRSGETKTKGKCYRSRGNCSSLLLYISMTPSYRIANEEEDMMTELMANGPVQALMKVKEDFFMYKSGIYRFSTRFRTDDFTDDGVGYHSVRIIGWGEEALQNGENIKYWVCANSWGQQWGENGYFRIERGQFEHFILAAHLSKFEFEFDGPPTAAALVALGQQDMQMLREYAFTKGGGSKSAGYNILIRSDNPPETLKKLQKEVTVATVEIKVRRKGRRGRRGGGDQSG